MKIKISIFFFILVVLALAVKAQPVIKLNTDGQNLDESFKSILYKQHTGKFWIAYGIIRNDDRNIFAGSYCFEEGSDNLKLRDIIDNTKRFQNYNPARAINKSNKKLQGRIRIENGISIDAGSDGETAILFLYDKNSKLVNNIIELSVCSLSHFFDLQNYPLYWFGIKDAANSLSFVSEVYKKLGDENIKEKILPGIGIHNVLKETTSLLINIAQNEKVLELKRNAVFWLGFQNNPAAYSALKNFIYKDHSFEMRKDAVMSLGLLELPEATDELIYIARRNTEEEIRKQAIYALGNKAVKKAEQALKNIIEDDPDIEIKKHAVYALANNLKDAIPFLIKLAKTNASFSIRKCAIYSLGNSDEKEAIDALIDLARN